MPNNLNHRTLRSTFESINTFEDIQGLTTASISDLPSLF